MNNLINLSKGYISQYLYYIIGIIFVLMLAFIGNQYISILKLKKDVATKETSIATLTTNLKLQNTLIEANKADYVNKLKLATKEIVKINTKYVPLYTSIDDFKGDTNETDCTNALNFLNTRKY